MPAPSSSAVPEARSAAWSRRWQALARGTVSAFHRYANWLVGITWLRFALLSVLLLVMAGVLSALPPFSYRVTETVSAPPPLPPAPAALPTPPAPPASEPGAATGPAANAPATPTAPTAPPTSTSPERRAPGVDIRIDERGVRILPRAAPLDGWHDCRSA